MGSTGVLEAIQGLIERTVGPQAWVLGVFFVGMTVMTIVVFKAHKRGASMTRQMILVVAALVVTMLLILLAFGPLALDLLTGRWMLFFAAGVGGYVVYAKVLERLIQSAAERRQSAGKRVASAGDGDGEEGGGPGGSV